MTATHVRMAVLEVNDGLTWLRELDKIRGLKPLAHKFRENLQERRDNADETEDGQRS